MEFNIETRKKQLENLDQFINSSAGKIQSILDCLGWTKEGVIEGEELVNCSINPEHKVPAKKLESHLNKCSLRSKGYDESNEYLSDPPENPSTLLRIDEQTLADLLRKDELKNKTLEKSPKEQKETYPKTSDRLLSSYTREERLKLYDYVRGHKLGPKAPPEFNVTALSTSSNKELTAEELKIAERDAKRRRVKYKSVHTSRKSQTEIMREVIDSQMDQYKQWIEDSSSLENKGENKVTNRTQKLDDSINEEYKKRDKYCDKDREKDKDKDSSSSTSESYRQKRHYSSHRRSSDKDRDRDRDRRSSSYSKQKYEHSYRRNYK